MRVRQTAWLLAAALTFYAHSSWGQAPPPPAASSSAASTPKQQKPTARQKAKAEKLYLKGLRAMQKRNGQAAEHDFALAAAADPSDSEYDLDRQVARAQAAMTLIRNADAARIRGNSTAADTEIKQALAIDPQDPEIAQHLDDLTSSTVPLNGAMATIAPEIELAPTPGKQSFHFRGTQRDVIQRVLAAYGLSVTFDDSVDLKQVSFDADDATFADAAKMVQLATNSFFVPLDPKRLLAAKSTRDNLARYQRESVETLRLTGLDPPGTDQADEITDIGNIARTVLGIQHATVQQTAATVTVRAPEGMLIALNRVVADLLESKSEVLVEVKIYQVARTKTLNLGVQPPQSVALFNVPSEVNNIIQQNQSLVQQIISSGLASAGDYSAIAALLIASGQVTNSILNQPFALFGGGLTESGVSLPGLTANLSLNSTDTRALDQIQLRLANNQDGTIRAGTRYPIETSSYSNLGATSANIPGLTTAGLSSTLAGLGVNLGSLSTAETIPQVQYQDLGMTLKVTPRIERGGDVALKLDLSLTALQGTSLNGLPVLTNQSYSADAVVQNGASALLVGDMSSELSKAIAGLPGLTDLPGFQSTTDTQTEHDVSSLVILITPHLLRQRKNEQVGPYIPLPLNSGN